MEKFTEAYLSGILSRFAYEGNIRSISQVDSGNVNHTYRVVAETENGDIRQYTLQKVNTYVFKDPKKVMSNILAVTEHLKEKYQEIYGDWNRRCLSVVKTKDESLYYDSPSEGFWRCFVFVDGVCAYDKVENPRHFYEAGHAFGEFQMNLADFDATTLYETIPNFHNTKKRFETFLQSVKNDAASRMHTVRPEIDFFLQRADKTAAIVEMLEKEEIPVRVTHNDTKLNNVLIDDVTGEAICVIDLDTVMPGSSLYDYGDAIRYGANTGAEDEEDLSRVSLDLNLFEQFTKGFVTKVTGFLTEKEIDNLALGAYVITLELAMRFLTDYLDGDVYFAMKKPNHNLHRTRAQICLAQDMEAKLSTMQEIVNKYR